MDFGNEGTTLTFLTTLSTVYLAARIKFPPKNLERGLFAHVEGVRVNS